MIRIIVILCALVVFGAPARAATPVQTASGYTGASATVTATFGSAPTSGNRIIAIVLRGGTTGLNTISGAGVSSWTAHASPSLGAVRFYVYSGLTDGSGSTVTVVFGAPQPFGLFLIEAEPTFTYEGVGTMQVGSSSPASSGSITNTSAAAMIIGVAQASSTVTSMGAATDSFTDITQPHVSVRCAYQIVASSASYSTTWTITAGTFSWNGLAIAFADSGGGGGGGGSTGGGLLLRGVGAALRVLWPFDGHSPVLGMQPHIGAIRADDVQLH